MNYDSEMYRLRIKTTLAFVQKMNFEEFLKKHFEASLEMNPDASLCDLFQDAIFDSLLAVEHAMKKNDNELLNYVNLLIEKLESEQGKDDEENVPLARLFAKLLIKAKNLCQAGLPVPGIIVTFEFKETWRVFGIFKKKIAEKMVVADKHNVARYSSN